MNPLVLKFIKHAGFVVAGAIVAALVAMINGDPTFTAFVAAHPLLSGLIPFVSGLLGALAKYIQDMDAA